MLQVLESEEENFAVMFDVWSQVVDKLSGPPQLQVTKLSCSLANYSSAIPALSGAKVGLVTLLDRIASYLGCWQIVLYNIRALGIVCLILCFTCFCWPGLRISTEFRQVFGFKGVGQPFANPS